MISNPRGDDVATCKMGVSDEQQTRRLQSAGWWEPAQCRQTMPVGSDARAATC